MCCSSPSPPPAPDYVGAAQAQGAANKEAAIASAQLSNPNITNPYGSQTVTYQNDPITGNPVPYVNQALSPIGQQRFDQNQRIDTGLGNLAEHGLGYVQNTLQQPFDQSLLPQRTVNAGQTGQDAIMARLEPSLERQRSQLRTQLYNQGLREGSEGYQNAMTDQGQRENDLLTQAALQGIGVGDSARNQAIQEQSFFRSEPLNILNAVRSASPVNVPQFQGYQGSTVAPPPIMQGQIAQGQAQQNAYNQQIAGDNAMMGGLFSLGGQVAGALPWATWLSDRRLKRDIRRVADDSRGFGIYEFRYLWDDQPFIGVMADEVEKVIPDAVMEVGGYKAVNYARL